VLGVDEAGSAWFAVRDADAVTGVGADTVTGDTLVADGAWHHVVAVMDVPSGQLALHVDGALDHPPFTMEQNDGSGFAQDTMEDVDPITVGHGRAPTTGDVVAEFGGMIDELSVYTRALTAADAQALSAAGVAGKCGASR
jgi:hypothetical protein